MGLVFTVRHVLSVSIVLCILTIHLPKFLSSHLFFLCRLLVVFSFLTDGMTMLVPNQLTKFCVRTYQSFFDSTFVWTDILTHYVLTQNQSIIIGSDTNRVRTKTCCVRTYLGTTTNGFHLIYIQFWIACHEDRRFSIVVGRRAEGSRPIRRGRDGARLPNSRSSSLKHSRSGSLRSVWVSFGRGVLQRCDVMGPL